MAVDDVSAAANRDLYERAQLVALEMIRKSLADLPGAIVRNSLDAAGDTGRHAGEATAGRTGPCAGTDISAGGAAGGAAGGPGAAGGGDSWIKRRLEGTTGAATGAAAQGAGMLAAKFSMILGPLAIFATVLGSAGSGFATLGKVVGVIASLFAAFLMPAVVAIAGALLDWSDSIEDDMLEAAKDFAGFVMTTLVPALRFVVDVLEGTIEVFRWLVDAIRDVINFVDDAIPSDEQVATIAAGPAAAAAAAEKAQAGMASMGDVLAGVVEKAGRDVTGAGNYAKGATAGAGGDYGAGGEKAEGMTTGGEPVKSKRSGIDDVIQSMRLSMGPRAQTLGLAAVRQQAQMAALQADPIEMRMLRIQQKSLENLEAVARNTARESAPAYPSGGE